MFNLEQINLALDTIIKVTVVLGAIYLLWQFCKAKKLEIEIEAIYAKFEEDMDTILNNTKNRGIERNFIDAQVVAKEKERDSAIAPLERRRQQILSRIPFLK
jgi:transcription elongation factor GreA-like protein